MDKFRLRLDYTHDMGYLINILFHLNVIPQVIKCWKGFILDRVLTRPKVPLK